MKAKKFLLSILCLGFVSLTMASCNTEDILNSNSNNSNTEEHVHEWNKGEIVDRATCTEAGLKAFTCTTCGETKLDVISAKGHDYKEIVTLPTCTEQGYTTHTCKNCYDSYVDSYVDTVAHTEVIDAAVESTCAKTGLTEGKHCSECNEVLIAQKIVTKLEHNYKDYVCVDCGYNYYTEGLKFRLSEDGESYSISSYSGTDTEVIIPTIYNNKPVTGIGNKAFDGCASLESINIPDSVTSIGEWAFFDCSSLTSITIPDSVTSIGEWAFFDCSSLKSVTIGNSVTSIGSRVFERCSSLRTVYYTGTEEQWNNISIDDTNYYLTDATIVYNYKG